MYKFNEYFNAYGFDKDRLEIALKHDIIEPFSRAFAYRLLQDIETEEYENYTPEFIYEKLQEYRDLGRIYSGRVTSLNFGQALALYFSLEMGNFSKELTEPLLLDSDVVLTSYYVVYEDEYKLKQWMKDKRIKFISLDNYSSDVYYEKLFFYSQNEPPSDLQKDAVLIKSLERLKELTSKVGTSQGLIRAHSGAYDKALEVLKYFPGWSLLGEDNNLYSDYFLSLTQAITGNEYYGAYLISDISREYFGRDEILDIYPFLSKRGLGKYCAKTYGINEKIPKGNYDVRKPFNGEVYATNVSDISSIPEGAIVQEHLPKTELTTAVLIIASWDTFWYKQSKLLPEELQEAIQIFFRGLGIAHNNARFGYLAFTLHFTIVDKLPKLYDITLGNKDLVKKWEVKHCIKPVLERSNCRLVLWEHVPSQKVFDQFKELVQSAAIMQFVGDGVTWTDEKLIETHLQASGKDAFEQNIERKYFNWFLLDNDNNLLVYVSIFLKRDRYEIRIIARVHGYARKALILSVKDFYCKVPASSIIANVDLNNKASTALFDSMYPSWTRETDKNTITYVHNFE